jgi:hypothetical protein
MVIVNLLSEMEIFSNRWICDNFVHRNTNNSVVKVKGDIAGGNK